MMSLIMMQLDVSLISRRKEFDYYHTISGSIRTYRDKYNFKVGYFYFIFPFHFLLSPLHFRGNYCMFPPLFDNFSY